MGASIITISNYDRCRDAENIAEQTEAKIFEPSREKENIPIACDHWILDNEEIVPCLIAYQLEGSKTPGELALLLQNNMLITGELVCYSLQN